MSIASDPHRDVAAAVDDLLALVARRVDDIRDGRCLPDDVELGLRAAGINRMLLPASLGGLEVPTSVAMGVYATALWLIGRASALPALAEPAADQGALELDVRRASKRRAVRSAASIRARLARKRQEP